MKVVAICFTQNGAELIKRLKDELAEWDIQGFCKSDKVDGTKYGLTEVTGSASDIVKKCFAEKTPIIFISACGIAVRLIAPYIADKLEDIPVVVVDESGINIIPILSGHVGGANEIAFRISKAIGANPVITTATDVNRAFSVDSFAMENRLTIRNKESIKSVSSKALKGEPIRISIEDFPPEKCADVVLSKSQISGDYLWLSPKEYVLGVGCKKGKDMKDIEEAVKDALKKAGIDFSDIYAFGSIDRKADEEGLLGLSAFYRIPFVTFTAEMLNNVPGEFSSSDFVKETVGVDNVCERAAMLLTGGQGELVLGKQSGNGVTVAIARRNF